MSKENDREHGDWLDPETSSGSRRAVAGALKAMGYEVDADDLDSVAALVRRIVEEEAQKSVDLSFLLANELKTTPAIPLKADALDTVRLRAAFDLKSRSRPTDMADDGLIDEIPTRGTQRAISPETVGVEQVLAWASEHDAGSAQSWHEISRKAPNVEHLTVYLKSAIDALPRQDESWIARLLAVINPSSSLPVAKVFIDHAVTKNSGRFTLKYGRDHWKMDFVAGADYLVLIIVGDDMEQPLETHITTSNPQAFSEEMLRAFHGHTQYARVALESLVETFEMPIGGRRRRAH